MRSSLFPTRPAILVLEDDPDTREVIRAAATEEFIVFEAWEAAMALAVCKVAIVRLVLVDLNLAAGRTSGRGFIRRYRELGQPGKIALLTAELDADKIGRELQVDAVIRKPFDLDDLLGTIRRLTLN